MYSVHAIIGAVCIVVLFVMIWGYGQYIEIETVKVFDLVNSVLGLLEDRYEMSKESASVDPFLSVDETRETIFSTSNGVNKESLWLSAVDWIVFNESHIRLETRQLSGKDFSVWRWIPIDDNDVDGLETQEQSMGGNHVAVWQGKALEDYPQHVARRLAVRRGKPTRCVKLKNVFDIAKQQLSDTAVADIENAILKKCVQLGGITHIHVSRTSREGTVYLRCHSKEEAFDIRESLHGTWFNGKLITASYVHEARYDTRFPEAAKSNKLLFPTT
ncbi:inner nuclear membrane protein Man1-like isoform X2 [Corticium candelabrum]|nr:inner nuclear membrane protein Man1-like isoform X2 [Corticium candelabrum]